MTALLLTVGSALLMVLAQSPFGFWPLALFALIPLTLLARTPRRRRGWFLAAYVGGATLFAGGCYWLAETSPVNLILMTVAEALVFPVYLILVRSFRSWLRAPYTLVIPVAWVAVEYTRSHWPFNGFPWLLLGSSLYRPIELAQAADLAGVFGLSLVLALANGLLLDAWEAWGRHRRKGIATLLLLSALLLPVLLYTYGRVRVGQVLRQESAGPVLALVQANVPQGLKQKLKSSTKIWTYQMDATETLLAQAGAHGFDLLCWAETMFPGGLLHESDAWSRAVDERVVAEALLRPRLTPLGASFLTGSTTFEEPGTLGPTYNAALLFGSDGLRSGRYAKSVLVPGGEFIPLRRFLPDRIDSLVEDFTGGFLPRLSAGSGPVRLTLRARDGREFHFATTICYENCYPGYSARSAGLGVHFLINLSNEAWFKDSVEFDQMDVATRFRAIEARRAVVRVTNSGISGFYDAVGHRRQVLVAADGRDRAVQGHLVATVPVFGSHSLFVRSGNLIPVLVTALAFLWSLLGAARAVRRYRAARAP